MDTVVHVVHDWVASARVEGPGLQLASRLAEPHREPV